MSNGFPYQKNYFICDICKEKIENVDDGDVKWNETTGEKRTCSNLKLIHRTCLDEDEEDLSDRDLTSFLGYDGLMNFLEFLIDDKFEDIKEVVEMIKRLHINGYEVVKDYIPEAIEKGVIDINSEQTCIDQGRIRAIIDYLNLPKNN